MLIPASIRAGQNEYIRMVTGTLTDDLSGALLANTEIRWDVVEEAGFKTSGPFRALTDASGEYAVRLSSVGAAATFLPVVPGYTITQGQAGVATLIGTGTQIDIAISNLRCIRLADIRPEIAISGNLSLAVQDAEWTNQITLDIQPIFPTHAGYAYSTLVPAIYAADPDSITTGRGVHVRYLWGTTNWSQSDVSASGIPYEYPSGVVTLDNEVYLSTDTFRPTEIFPSGDRYLAALIEASGINGSAYGPLQTIRVRYDTGDPLDPWFQTDPSGYATDVSIALSGVVDDQTGSDVTYRVRLLDNSDAILRTSAWASGLLYSEAGLTANTPYKALGQARDAAGNIGSFTDPSRSFVTLAPVPTQSDLVATPVTAHGASNTMRLTATAIPNDADVSTAYRFQRWNGDVRDLGATSAADSGWIAARVWDDTELVPGRTYTWSLMYRNQLLVPTPQAAITLVMPFPTTVPEAQPAITFQPLAPVLLTSTSSPMRRHAVRVERIEGIHRRYARRSVATSHPHRLESPAYQIRLAVEDSVPPDFPSDGTWIEYRVSFGADGVQYPLVPIGRPNTTTLVLNSQLDPESRVLAAAAGWTFVDLPHVVTGVQVWIYLSRPEDLTDSTPVVYQYTLIVTPRRALTTRPLERGVAPQAVLGQS